jgi:RNA polymerase sigma-70 factor, ECF subfamily
MTRFWLTLRPGESGELWLSEAEVRRLRAASLLEQRVGELFGVLQAPVYRYLCGLLPDRGEAEDVAQETFLRLYSHLHKGHAVGNVRAWVFRVAHNLAVDLHRRRSSPAGAALAEGWDASAEEQRDPAPSAEQRVLEKEERQRLRRALATLSPQERSCLDLRAEGLGYREIAEVLGVGVSTVSTFLSRGVRKIAREIHE